MIGFRGFVSYGPAIVVLRAIVTASPLGNHQVIVLLDLVNVRRFRPHRPLERPIPEHVRLSDEAHGAQVKLLEPDFGVPVVLAVGSEPAADILRPPIIVEEQ